MMYKSSFKTLAVSVVASAFLVGCGGGGSSSSDVVDVVDIVPPVSVNTYIGDRTVTGTVEQFAATSSLRDLRDTSTTEVVKLYVLDDNGEMKDTNITCPVTTDGYTCSNVAGDKEYIVRYMKYLGDGKVLEMKSNVTVPATGNPEAVKVDRVSTLVVEAISKAVEEAIVGIDIDEDKIAELIDSVKTAIKASIVSLVQQGIISVPTQADMEVEVVEGESFEDFTASQDVVVNESLESASSLIAEDDAVANTLSASKNDAIVGEYANMTQKELVRAIFEQTMGDDIPDWIVDFLADKYSVQEYTVNEFLAKLAFTSQAIDDAGAWNPDPWYVEELKRAGIESDPEAFVRGILEDINADVTDGTALSKFKAEIATHYALKEDDNKTETEYEKLADFPPIIEYLFTKEFAAAMTADTNFENMGQAIVLISYLESVLAKDATLAAFIAALGDGNFFADQVENMHIVETDPMFIFTDLGFEAGSTYDTMSINNRFEANTQNSWDNDAQEEREFLTVYAGIEKPSWMMGGETTLDAGDFTATLTYPTATGSEEIDLDVEVRGDFVQFTHAPWSENSTVPDETKMNVTDHISGDYVVSATYGGETVSKTFKDVFVLKGASDYRATLTSPKEMPQYKDNMTSAEQTAFNEAWNAYNQEGPTTFAAGVDGTVKDVLFTWSDTDLKSGLTTLGLPENIVPAYQVSINLYNPIDTNNDSVIDYNDCNGEDSWQLCNTEIYNTWWNNRPVKGTSLKLPIALKENTLDGRYNINVNLVFLDKETGHQVGQGGHTWAEFKVGTPTVLSGTETITFSGKVTADDNGTAITNNKIKVGLIEESCTFDETTFTHTCTDEMISVTIPASDGTYSLDVNASTVKTVMSVNGAHISLIAFSDENNDSVWTNWDPTLTEIENSAAEPAWWPNNKWFNFENWGELRINIDGNDANGTYTHESYTIKPDTNVTVDDMNIVTYTGYYIPTTDDGTVTPTLPTDDNLTTPVDLQDPVADITGILGKAVYSLDGDDYSKWYSVFTVPSEFTVAAFNASTASDKYYYNYDGTWYISADDSGMSETTSVTLSSDNKTVTLVSTYSDGIHPASTDTEKVSIIAQTDTYWTIQMEHESTGDMGTYSDVKHMDWYFAPTADMQNIAATAIAEPTTSAVASAARSSQLFR